MVHIKVENVSVGFPIYGGASRSLKNAIIRVGTGGRIDHDSHDRLYIQALQDVTFQLEEGDRLAIVGMNGAGKTTLLRVLAGIFEVTQGSVETKGRISPLFDAALGMDLEATGYENIALRGLFLGLNPSVIKRRIPEIAEFTELGDYLEMPARTYSNGMLLRLGFAVSTCLEPEILLMDEWVGMGDSHFFEKAQKRMDYFVNQAGIVVMASHSEALVRSLCNKAILLDRGVIVGTGGVDEVLDAYGSLNAS